MEIERKFLVRKLPNLAGIRKVVYERYYLYKGNGIEIRIQKKMNRYEFERKIETTHLSRETQKFEITKQEFEFLKGQASEALVRDSYLISENPEVSIKIYHGRFEGLMRAEVEFKTEEEAEKFSAPEWFGSEISNSSLGRDSKLICILN